MPIRGLALTLLTTTLVAAPALAPAQPKGKPKPPDAAAGDAAYEEIAASAVRVDRLGLAGLAWAVTARCEAGDELARRQCRAIRAIRLRGVEGRTFVVAGDAAALSIGAWDGQKKALPVSVTGCVACADPVVVDDLALFVVAAKGAAAQGDAARPPVIADGARAFASEAEAAKWSAEVAPRLKTELVVRVIGADKAAWEQGGRRGITVEAVGARVWDPCDGAVVAAWPRAATAPVDRAACGEAAEPKKGPAPKKEQLPDELDSDAIKRAMAPVRAAAQKCFDTYQVPGDAKLRVTVADGAVAAIEQTGDFADTPTGACIEKAVREVTFPRTKKAKQSFNYPIVLR